MSPHSHLRRDPCCSPGWLTVHTRGYGQESLEGKLRIVSDSPRRDKKTTADEISGVATAARDGGLAKEN